MSSAALAADEAETAFFSASVEDVLKKALREEYATVAEADHPFFGIDRSVVGATYSNVLIDYKSLTDEELTKNIDEALRIMSAPYDPTILVSPQEYERIQELEAERIRKQYAGIGEWIPDIKKREGFKFTQSETTEESAMEAAQELKRAPTLDEVRKQRRAKQAGIVSAMAAAVAGDVEAAKSRELANVATRLVKPDGMPFGKILPFDPPKYIPEVGLSAYFYTGSPAHGAAIKPDADPVTPSKPRRVSTNGRDWLDYDKLNDPDPFESYKYRMTDGVYTTQRILMCSADTVVDGKVKPCWKAAKKRVTRHGTVQHCDECHIKNEGIRAQKTADRKEDVEAWIRMGKMDMDYPGPTSRASCHPTAFGGIWSTGEGHRRPGRGGLSRSVREEAER